MTSKVNVVFPEDSGPYISTTLPLGKPPIPSAISNPNEPVGMDGIFSRTLSPMRIIAFSPGPLSNLDPICFNAFSKLFVLSFSLFTSILVTFFCAMSTS